MSWHINQSGKSVIKEALNLLQKNANTYYIVIYTENDSFWIYKDDEVVVGVGTLLVRSYDANGCLYMRLVNTNKIEYIELKQIGKKTKDINIDSEKE